MSSFSAISLLLYGMWYLLNCTHYLVGTVPVGTARSNFVLTTRVHTILSHYYVVPKKLSVEFLYDLVQQVGLLFTGQNIRVRYASSP